MLTEDAFELAGLAARRRPYVFAGAGPLLESRPARRVRRDDRASRSPYERRSTIDELAARLDEVLLLDVRTPQEYDGTRWPALRPAAGPHSRRAEPRRLPARWSSTPDELARRAAASRRARDRRVLPQRLALAIWRRRRCARTATTRATTSARGTSGRATTTCRSSVRPADGCGQERAAEAAAELLPARSSSASSSRSSSARGRGRSRPRPTRRAPARGAPRDGTARPTRTRPRGTPARPAPWRAARRRPAPRTRSAFPLNDAEAAAAARRAPGRARPPPSARVS